MAKKNIELPENKCSLKEVLDILGGKWALPIIYTLSKGTLRFKELVKELKNMEANGIVIRAVFATVPPTVEYTLTEKGEKLVPIIYDLHAWGQAYTI